MPEKSYPLSKVYKKTNQVFIAKNLTLINDSTINFINTKTRNYETLSLNEIGSLKIKTGTHALRYGLSGGTLATTSVLLSWLRYESDPNSASIETNWTPIFAGVIVGATVAGIIIGMASPKWTTVSLPMKKSPNSYFKIYPNISVQKNYLSLIINFNL